MSIEDLTDDQLEAFAANYSRAKKSEGGIYKLSEILLEQRRRSPSPFGTREVAAKIFNWLGSPTINLRRMENCGNLFVPAHLGWVMLRSELFVKALLRSLPIAFGTNCQLSPLWW